MSDKIEIPEHLTSESQKLFEYVITNYELEEHHVHLLLMACEAKDRTKQARKAIENMI